MKKRIFISGATGALGSEAIKVVRDYSDRLELVGFSGHKNIQRVLDLCREFHPRFVGVHPDFVKYTSERCNDENIQVFDVSTELREVVLNTNPDLALFLASGITSLSAIYAALKYGISIGIGNKESIIAGGHIIFSSNFLDKIIPVDSEPSAIFQCLIGEKKSTVRRLIITASGGPFLNTESSKLQFVTPEEALKHPNWKMGKKITIDSATMANKAFEVIEAHFLFGLPYEKINALIHRESIIHSMVEFSDGNIKALLSPTRMYYPLQFAMFYPDRIKNKAKSLDLTSVGKFTFKNLDTGKFPLFPFILRVAKNENNLPALVAADEVAVKAFLDKKIRFTEIYTVMSEVFEVYTPMPVSSLKEIEEEYERSLQITNDVVKRRAL